MVADDEYSSREERVSKNTPGNIKIMHLPRLQGGGQVKWKPTEKKRPHHSSSIQLPAVYETWKEPSRVNRRRTQAAAAVAAEARRSSRSVPTISRRSKTESPERVSNSAPSSKPLPSNHDRHNSDLTSKKTVTPSRLPKINTLVEGAPESNSSADSPTQKQKHSRPRDAGHKTTSPLSPKEQKTNDMAVHSKGDRLNGHVEENNNNVLPKVGKEKTHSKKLPTDSKHHLEKKDNVISVPKDGPSVRLKASNPSEKKTEDKDGKTKDTTNEGTGDYQTTNRTKDDYIVNISDKSEQILNDLPKRTLERTKSDKKTTLSHTSVAKARQNKTTHKSNDEGKTRMIKNETVMDGSHPKERPQTNLTNQRVTDVNSPSKAPPSRATHSRIGTGFSSRVNPRSRSNQFRSKPPLQRRHTKTGFFTSSGEFVTNDEEGKQSEVSVETSRTKRTDASTATLKSNVSGSTTSAISTTSSENSRKPLRRRPVIITKKTLARQKFYNSVYNNQHYKIQRQTAFLKKVENAQLKIDDEKNREYMDTKKKKYESVVRQYQTLKRIRDKFDEEQVKRFSRQYVSWRSVEEDRLNRQSSQYGLPDNIYEDRYDKTLKEIPKLTKPKSKSNLKSDKKFSRFARWVQNIRRFERILKPNIGAGLEESMLRSTKGALVEGKDIVELHQSRDDSSEKGQGQIRTKKIVKVRNVIGSAKRLLQATQDMDAISEVSDENDDGGDDDFSDVSSLDLSDDDE
ncbi:uncharacterized protein LOC121425532 isoform X2 [Lytechinus variegatus]|uniref:uncharacterized protein LOC121425532 isoform X2 n=1 Tax=Lytechinus variegatus TaxID=7654 RepID=UPI001BB29FC2|nr:uncharacterized protein LOC121425532 isoform X2 [Lytechinus variegatus]